MLNGSKNWAEADLTLTHDILRDNAVCQPTSQIRGRSVADFDKKMPSVNDKDVEIFDTENTQKAALCQTGADTNEIWFSRVRWTGEN